MGSKTGVEYVDATWNPWSGCTPVSAGCANCYAERMATRFGRDFSTVTRAPDRRFHDPAFWKTAKRILTCSTSDFFHKGADDWREYAWSNIRDTPYHTYLILTKRPERIPECLPTFGGAAKKWPWPNVWLGASVENQEHDQRIRDLLKVQAAKRFLSLEPLLGPVDLSPFLCKDSVATSVTGEKASFRCGVRWVIVGGESGPGARPMHPDWARSIRDQCKAAGVPFFMKQMSKRAPIPADLQIKEFPH